MSTEVEQQVRQFIDDNFLFRGDSDSLARRRVAARRRADRFDRHARAGRLHRDRVRDPRRRCRDRAGEPRFDRDDHGLCHRQAGRHGAIGSRLTAATRGTQGAKRCGSRTFCATAPGGCRARSRSSAGKRRLTFARARRHVRPPGGGARPARHRARRPRRRVHGELFEAVVAIFAVLKAGAVFSPVNPSTKSDKLAFILNNCRAAGIITQARLRRHRRDGGGAERIGEARRSRRRRHGPGCRWLPLLRGGDHTTSAVRRQSRAATSTSP